MVFVPEGPCDRSLARSAWDIATPREPSRRVRYNSCRCAHFGSVIEVIGVTKFRPLKQKIFMCSKTVHHIEQQFEHHRAFRPLRSVLSYGTRFRRGRPPGLAAPDHTVPYGTDLSGHDRGRDKEGFAPPTEPDWHISCIRLSSWWLAFKKIGVPQCALVLRRTSPPRRSRCLAIGSDLFLWPGLFASSGA